MLNQLPNSGIYPVSPENEVWAEQDPSFWDTVDDFQEKAMEFTRVFSRLRDLRYLIPNAPDSTKFKYEQAMEGGNAIMDRIESVKNTIGSVTGWVTGLFGVEKTVDGANELGILPLIPIAIIAAAIALIIKWLSGAYVVLEELEAAENLVSQGTPAAQAFDMVRSSQGGIFENATNAIVLLGVAALVIFMLPKLGK